MKHTIIISLLLLFVGCNSKQSDYIINDDFLQDLSSENNRVWGDLYEDVFNEQLDSLTYDYYINYLDSTQLSAAEGLVEKIQLANKVLLKPYNQTFWLLLYYESDERIIADDASTDIGTPDTSFNYLNKSIPPDLNVYFMKVLK